MTRHGGLGLGLAHRSVTVSMMLQLVVNERRASMFDICEALSMSTQLLHILYYGNLLLVSFGTSSGFKSLRL